MTIRPPGEMSTKCSFRAGIVLRRKNVYLQRRMDANVEGCEPLFLFADLMITKERVKELLHEAFGEGPLFFVEVEVSGANDIRVLVDNDHGVSIVDCVKVSRVLESSFDRDIEDFSLNVSSPGADQPLRIARQYVKNIGRDLAVKLHDGGKITGTLTAADDEKANVLVREKKRIEEKKSKEWVEEVFELPYDQIKEAKVVISFK